MKTPLRFAEIALVSVILALSGLPREVQILAVLLYTVATFRR